MQPDPSFWSDRDVCVTGGTGFLGWHLVQALRDVKARVRVVALEPGPEHPIHHLQDVSCHWGDVRDPALLHTALAGCSVVFHTAGVVGVWGKQLERMWSVHVDGTRRVLSALDADACLVHTSSITTLGASDRPIPTDEATTWNGAAAQVPYVAAKREAERIALDAASSGRRVLVTNPGYLVGPEDYERSIMGRLCERFWRGRAPVAPPGGINIVDVRDVALGHLLAAERGRTGRRYILGGANQTFAAFFFLLAEAAGYRPRGLPCFPWLAFAALAGLAELRSKMTGKEPYPSLAHAAMNRFYWYGSSALAESELGYRPRPLDESLRDAFAWHATLKPFQLRGFNRWWLRPERVAANGLGLEELGTRI